MPHPISLFAILGDMIVNDEIEKINRTYFELAPTWGLGLNRNKDYKGQPGLPDEYLYICYTDQKAKFNPHVLPTSIIFKSKEDAIRVLRFEPTIADFDIKSKMRKQNETPYFKPHKQVPIVWQKRSQIGIPTSGF